MKLFYLCQIFREFTVNACVIIIFWMHDTSSRVADTFSYIVYTRVETQVESSGSHFPWVKWV